MTSSPDTFSGSREASHTSLRRLLSSGADIKTLGLLFLVSGVIDFLWILSYPEYALKVFGTTFSGWARALVKFQHPSIHWAIGFGFWKKRWWAYVTYLVYLFLACLSETITQVIDGYHPTRTTMIMISLLFGVYIVSRRKVFQ